MNESLVLVNTVHKQASTSPDVVDSIIYQLLNTGTLGNDIEAVCMQVEVTREMSQRQRLFSPFLTTLPCPTLTWVIFLNLIPLSLGTWSPLQLDILIRCTQLPRQVHLDTFV